MIPVAWVAALILHNFVYNLFKEFFDRHGGDEYFFAIIAIIVIPLYLVISFVYTIIYYIRKKIHKKPKTKT